MKYVIEIPEEVGRSLEARAAATGEEVVRLIERVIVQFTQSGIPSLSIGRIPDPPIEPVEIVAPCDLPRNACRPVAVQRKSNRHLDPVSDLL